MKKISIDLNGGLGNQLFQYSFAMALSRIHNLNVSLNSYLLKKDNQRELELGKLISFKDDELLSVSFESSSFIDEVAYRISKRMNASILGRYCESNLRYDQDILAISKSDKYRGYWQSPKYFQSYRNEIIESIKFDHIDKDKLSRLIEVDDSFKSVSIHVRRGDYISNPEAAKVHGGVCDMDYYKHAVDFIVKNYDNVKFFIFSDDRSWCETEFQWLPNSQVIQETKDHFEDMYLMANCDINVIANSTFSWWAAYINRKNETVIAPKKWFSNDMEIDIYPHGWVLI